MIVLIRKRDLILCVLVCGFFACFSAIFLQGINDTAPVFAPRDGAPVTVIIDPGHGGEDGGAVSPSGVEESQINLAVSLRLNALLRDSVRK